MPTLSDAETIERFLSLKRDCLENPVFLEMLDEVEQDIKNSVITSPEIATEAHYELKALQRLRGKLTAIEVSYEGILRREQDSQSY